MGTGRFVAPKTIEVSLNDGGTRTLVGDKVFLNVGTHAAIPNVPGLEAAKPLTHIEALELDVLPEHLIVIGGGYAGLELAQAYRRFGAQVTVVEVGTQLMAREDSDVAQEIHRLLSNEGLAIHAGVQLLKVEGQSGKEVRLVMRTSSGEQAIAGSHILVAAGRVPNTAGAGLDIAGVDLDDRGFVRSSTSGSRRARQTSGLSAIARAARCSPTYRRTTFASCATIWLAESAARTTEYPVLHVHRSAARPCGLERARSRTSGRQDRIASCR